VLFFFLIFWLHRLEAFPKPALLLYIVKYFWSGSAFGERKRKARVTDDSRVVERRFFVRKGKGGTQTIRHNTIENVWCIIVVTVVWGG